MTSLCAHKRNESCEHCEYGCQSCGVLEGPKESLLDDDGYCPDCAFDRQLFAADMIYDQMKEGGLQ